MAKTNRKSKATINALSKAKSFYAERGDFNSCGDWLAVALEDAFRTEGGDFDLEGFTRCLKENRIEPPKVDHNKHGWRGRFRAAKRGFVVVEGKKIAAPGAKKRG